jgi:hypothetical protein
VPETSTTAAATQRPAAALAEIVGKDHAQTLIKAGWDALRPAIAARPDLVHPGTADYVVALVLVGALSGFTQAEIRGGLLEGARDAVRDAELAAIAHAIRVAYLAAKSTPHNPIEGLIRLADDAGVDLDGTGPASPPEPSDDDPPGDAPS